MAVKHSVKGSLTFVILATLVLIVSPSLVVASADDAATSEVQKKNRSKFEYHDGSAAEKRPYRRPNLDIDPTNLRLEELTARINALEERVETLEYQSRSSKRVQ